MPNGHDIPHGVEQRIQAAESFWRQIRQWQKELAEIQRQAEPQFEAVRQIRSMVAELVVGRLPDTTDLTRALTALDDLQRAHQVLVNEHLTRKPKSSEHQAGQAIKEEGYQ